MEGYYLPPTADAANYYTPITPDRIIDTRSGLNVGGSTTPVSAQGVLSVPIQGVVGSTGAITVPASKKISAVMLSVTAVWPSATGGLATWPEGGVPGNGTFATYTVPGQGYMTGSVVAKVGDNGRVSVFTSASTHLVVDVQGYFVDTPPPAPPASTLTSTTFTANGWVASGTTGAFMASAAAPANDPAVDHYDWAVDDPSLANAQRVNVSANTAGTISLTGTNAPKDGWHTLYVRSGNTAGNVSAPVTYVYGVGVAITGPAQGTRVTQYLRLNGKSPASYGSVTWNYRRAATDAWTVVPAGDVTKAGTGIGSWPVTLTASGATATAPELVWDAKTSLNKDTPILLQACYTPTGGGNASCTADSAAPTVTLDQLNAGNVDSTTKVAGGTADLLTGNFAISETDISVAAPGAMLAVSRTFNSADPTRTTNQATGAASAFGPGWTTGLPVGSANSDWTGVSDYGSEVAAYDSGGAAVFFAQQSGGGYKPVGDDADSGLTLTAGSAGSYGPTSFTVADLDGNATKFDAKGTFTGNPSPAAPHPYQVSAVTQPGNAQTTTYTYDTSGRVTQILAPVPAGSTCTGATVGSGTWTGGCKALNLTYGTSGTANGRLTAVTLRTTSTAGAELDVDVACYAYDAAARLAAVWDPRDGTAGTGAHPVTCGSQVRPTAYTYDAAGRIATITPPGLAAWNLAYDTNGRLDTVSRTHDSAHGGGTETTQLVYGVATTADATHGEYRPDLGATAIAGWGQKEAPVTATAVFGP
ncbi:MAG TPA: DUF6531 domain-containing protein, partial [Kineosporiaceae bacterium]|nr:DUF6531 domain-containing protein [Kineosporiaceae bacterium]